MAEIAKISSGVSLSTPLPGLEHKIAGDLFAGESLAIGDIGFIAADGTVYRCNGKVKAAITNPTTALTVSVAPAPNGPQGSGAGSLPPGTYYATYTVSDETGETLQNTESAQFTITPGDIPTFTFPAAPAAGNEYNLYLTPANGASGSEIRYRNGITNVPFNGTSAFPDNTPAPPVSNTTGTGVSQAANYHGVVPMAARAGEAVTLLHGVQFQYGRNLTPGTSYYPSATKVGGLCDIASAATGAKPVAFAVDTARVRFLAPVLLQ